MSPEQLRLSEQYTHTNNWYQWGPYLSERQWGTVREDYSPDGEVWKYFPHDHARSRVYRWGEDGIAGLTDEFCNLCFSVALWNGNDSIIKERLFGLSGIQGNHGEDVKELYYYLDNTPTHSYMKYLYKYPQQAFPYDELLQKNINRSKETGEFELYDTGIFDQGRYFDVFVEYAKASPDDILIKITIHNRADLPAPVSVLPTLWMRNLWSYGLMNNKPDIVLDEISKDYSSVKAVHEKLGTYTLYFEKAGYTLFTENETNSQRIFGQPNQSPFVKDAINDAVVSENFSLLESRKNGTKFSPVYQTEIDGNGQHEIRLRLSKTKPHGEPLGTDFEKIFQARREEADSFYENICVGDKELKDIQRQAFANLLWNKQYYQLDIPRWLLGDPGQPTPPQNRQNGRNAKWFTLNNEDIISMPDKWEYPWYAAWDLAFHCIPLAMIDPGFAKSQLILFLREWYMRPNGQLPAYEWNFSDVNPPVHAFACMQVYRIEKKQTGKGDVDFLKKAFQKLLINFTWWVNRKDHNENNVFEGGFLGLDNIGIFDRSAFIPGGGHLEQADGTSWMAMYSLNMLDMALEIAQYDPAFEDVATKFFEHFVFITESLNRMSEDWTAAWDEAEGFFYDILVQPNGSYTPLKVRSLVGVTSFFATLVLDRERLNKVPDFVKRLKWFRSYRQKSGFYLAIEHLEDGEDILLSLTPRHRLERLMKALLDEQEFLSDGGVRSMSKQHEKPYSVNINGIDYGLKYEPAESSNSLFGGNSNWRGPVWMPMNYMIIQSLHTLDKYYKNSIQVACPDGCSTFENLGNVAADISKRLISLFEKDTKNERPIYGQNHLIQNDPHFAGYVHFYEYFHGENGKGLGASHQSWTCLVAELIDHVYKK